MANTGKIYEYKYPPKEIESLIRRVTIFVQPNWTYSQRIESGKYDFIYPGLESPKKRPLEDNDIFGYFEYRLLSDCKLIDSKQARILCEEDGWMIGKEPHLNAFATAFPEEQMKYNIVALGSLFQIRNLNEQFALYIDYKEGKRRVMPEYIESNLSPGIRFLSVRKISD